MNILIDTNVLMDALQERRPFDAEAKEILIRAQNGEFLRNYERRFIKRLL